MFFDIWCHGCRQHVLLWASNLEALQPSPSGMALFFHCQCGEPGMEVLHSTPPVRHPP